MLITNLFVESYTSQFAEGTLKELEMLVGKKLIEVKRKEVEEEAGELLKYCLNEDKNICLLIIGNALSATTHSELLIEAKRLKIEFKVLPGISVFSFLGFTGLSEYKFGRTASIVWPLPNYKPESFYDLVK